MRYYCINVPSSLRRENRNRMSSNTFADEFDFNDDEDSDETHEEERSDSTGNVGLKVESYRYTVGAKGQLTRGK